VNRLPLMFLDDGRGHVAGFSLSDHALFSDHHKILTSVADETNQNLNGPQKELLLWHHKLGHINFDWLQALARHGRDNPNSKRVFESKFSSIGNCRAPLCAACQMGKGKRRTTGAKKVFDVNAMKLKEQTLQPGDRLHIDQYKSNVTGGLQHTKGQEQSSLQYNGGLIAVDAASGKVFVRHQVSMAAGKTIQAMRAIAQDAKDHGIRIKSVHTDNAPFKSLEFRDYIAGELHAKQTFSGVGAHHQAGIAEHAIGTITSWARTMMLHSIIHWPDAADLQLWQFAMDHAVYIWNLLPHKETFVSPDELYSGIHHGWLCGGSGHFLRLLGSNSCLHFLLVAGV
jgi:GAG-pre-integrase domain